MKKRKKNLTFFIGITTVSVIVVITIIVAIIATGSIHVKKNKIIIATGSTTAKYTGETVSCEKYELVEGSLHDGDYLEMIYCTEAVNTGNYYNNQMYVIRNSKGKDVSSLYNIEVFAGTITIVPRQPAIRTFGAEKKYDGEPLKKDKWDWVVLDKVPDHRVEITLTGEQTEIGTSSNTFEPHVYDAEGNEVTENYQFSSELGELTVKSDTLWISTESYEKEYDGKPLDGGNAMVESGTLMKGHSLVTDSKTVLSDVRNTENVALFHIEDESGNDVTEEYDIATNYGKLSITPRKLVIKTESASKKYDGKPLTKPEYELAMGSLVEGHQMDVVMSSVVRYLGISDNKVHSVHIYSPLEDGSGTKDVTQNYMISYIFGRLEITK